jgi:imidazolonepropionase-like amidohydrolase
MPRKRFILLKSRRSLLAVTGATVHIGNGQVLNNATVLMVDGKITAVGTNVTIPARCAKIDAQGKHVYPGLILASSNLGLVELEM